MILVTGAAGMSGEMIIRELSDQGVPVKALVRDPSRVPAFDKDLVEVFVGDMARRETLGEALAGVDTALMISSASEEMLETQCAFVDACSAAGVRYVVKYSGTELGFRRERFRFARMHAEIEEYLEQSGLAWTNFRPSGFMQIFMREMPGIARTGELRLAAEDITLASVDARDVARIAARIVTSSDQEGRTWVITGPEALSMDEIAGKFGEALGRPVRYVPISPEERRQDLLAAGLPPYFVDGLIEQVMARLEAPRAKVDLTAHDRFGVRPTTFSEFLARALPADGEAAAA